MVRPLTIHEKPIFVPYVCIQCGLGEGRREWFLDLGFAIDNYFSVDNQAIYLCNECYNNMTLTVGRLIQTFRQDHEKWDSEEVPTYNWADNNISEEVENDVRESESIGPDAVPPGYVDLNEGTDSSTDGNDQDPESDDSEPESPDSGDADSVDDSDTDESDRQTFTAFFGDGGT